MNQSQTECMQKVRVEEPFTLFPERYWILNVRYNLCHENEVTRHGCNPTLRTTVVSFAVVRAQIEQGEGREMYHTSFKHLN